MTADEAAPALAIVGPDFFSYVEAIAAEFAERGIRVGVFDEKHSNARHAKIACRLRLPSPALVAQRRYLHRLAARLVNEGWSDVLLCGPELIDRRFVTQLVARGLRVHLFCWDGSRNKGRFCEYLDLLSARATFDPEDAARLGMDYVPLFARQAYLAAGRAGRRPPEHDLAFCGTVHSRRGAALARLLPLARRRGLRLKLMLYYHSRLLFCLRSLASPLAFRLLPLLRTRGFAEQEVAEQLGRSAIVLDFVHPRQSGLTARTFEALASGARLFTDHPRAGDLVPAQLRDRVTVFERIEALALLLPTRLVRPGPLPPGAEYGLSIARFVDDLVQAMRWGQRWLSPTGLALAQLGSAEPAVPCLGEHCSAGQRREQQREEKEGQMRSRQHHQQAQPQH